MPSTAPSASHREPRRSGVQLAHSVTVAARPLDVLLQLVDAGASGELVCVAPASELHIYLQVGRIAWATDSALPFAFSRYLLAHTSLTRETFSEVLESCRRDRLLLGETLIAWNVVAFSDVRTALENQIRGALRTLAECTSERTMFLERQSQVLTYDVRLTFDAFALVAEPASMSASTATTTGERIREPIPNDLLERVRAEIPDAAWLEVLEGGYVADRSPRDGRTFVPKQVLMHALHDDADLVALRTPHATLLGVAMPTHGRTLWCGLEPSAAFGIALSTLSHFADIPLTALENAARPPSPSTPPSGFGKAASEVEAFMQRAPEVDGVLVMEGDNVVSSTGRAPFDADAMAATVRRRALALSAIVDVGSDANVGDAQPEDVASHVTTIVTGEEHVWCFGADLGGDPKRTLWIFMARRCAQGLGWAYLASLARKLATSSPRGDGGSF